MFFSMILTLALDSQFGMAEAVISGIQDQVTAAFPREKFKITNT